MILKLSDNSAYLQFPHLAAFKEVRHAVFLKLGGYSKGPFCGLNIGCQTSDSAAVIKQNQRLIAKVLGSKKIIKINQVHGSVPLIWPDDFSFEKERHSTLSGDALMTRKNKSDLLIQTADCQAVMLFDKNKKVVANIHAGWRGTIQNIIGKTISAMENRFNTRPADLLAGIGPSLGPCCAEFINYQKEIPKSYWPYKNNDNYFNFWAISRNQLEQAGVSPDNIINSRICTKCNRKLFYSFRGTNLTGRFASIIGLRVSQEKKQK